MLKNWNKIFYYTSEKSTSGLNEPKESMDQLSKELRTAHAHAHTTAMAAKTS